MTGRLDTDGIFGPNTEDAFDFSTTETTTTEGYDEGDYFIADSFAFGVEREMKESGEKGGTEDINIGVGELQECTVSKSMDEALVVYDHGGDLIF